MQRQSAAVLTHVRAVLIIMHGVVVWFSGPSFMIAAVSHSQSAGLYEQERSMSLYSKKIKCHRAAQYKAKTLCKPSLPSKFISLLASCCKYMPDARAHK